MFYSMNITVTDNEFLKQSPTDLHVRRLAMQYSITEIKELAIHLGMVYNEWDRMHDELSDPERLKFEILLRCIDRSSFTFHDIKKAVEEVYIRNPHTICSVSWIFYFNLLFLHLNATQSVL